MSHPLSISKNLGSCGSDKTQLSLGKRKGSPSHRAVRLLISSESSPPLGHRPYSAGRISCLWNSHDAERFLGSARPRAIMSINDEASRNGCFSNRETWKSLSWLGTLSDYMTLFWGWSKASSTKQFFYVSLPILLKISQEFFNSETYETQLIPSVPHQFPLAVKSPGLTSVIFVALAPQNVGIHYWTVNFTASCLRLV